MLLNGVFGMMQLLCLIDFIDKQVGFVNMFENLGWVLCDLIEDIFDIFKIEVGVVDLLNELFDVV